MLDTTSTATIIEAKPPEFVYSIAKLQQATGLTRLTFGLIRDTKLEENGYTVKEKADYKLFNYHVINNALIDQGKLLMENIKEVNKLDFPVDIPVLKIISKQSIDGMAKKDKDDGMGYQKAHLSRLGENVTYNVVEATHFLYHTKAQEIVKLTDDFLAKMKKGGVSNV